METEAFWRLIADSRESAAGRGAREEYLRTRLAAMPGDDIVAFHAHVCAATVRADVWDLVQAYGRILGGRFSDDGYEYFRLWLVGCGREAFERALVDADSLAAIPEIQELARQHSTEECDDTLWPEWEGLDYVARDAFATATGDDEDGEAFDDAVEEVSEHPDTRLEPADDQWSIRDEAESARRLPRLTAMFPLVARDRSTWSA